MGILDRIIGAVKRAFFRSVEDKVEEVVEDQVEKAVDKAATNTLRKNGVEISSGNTSTESSSLREVEEASEASGGNVSINININGNAAPASQAIAASYAASMAQANEVLSYLILDENNNVIGVKDDAPDYIKNAYRNGEFDTENE